MRSSFRGWQVHDQPDARAKQRDHRVMFRSPPRRSQGLHHPVYRHRRDAADGYPCDEGRQGTAIIDHRERLILDSTALCAGRLMPRQIQRINQVASGLCFRMPLRHLENRTTLLRAQWPKRLSRFRLPMVQSEQDWPRRFTAVDSGVWQSRQALRYRISDEDQKPYQTAGEWAGLVQLRNHISREELAQNVKNFHRQGLFPDLIDLPAKVRLAMVAPK